MNLTKNININKNTGGEYEYEIDITNNLKRANNTGGPNIGDSVGSNPGSVVGHYNDHIDAQSNGGSSVVNQFGSIVGVAGNISVKKSMMKIGQTQDQRQTADLDHNLY